MRSVLAVGLAASLLGSLLSPSAAAPAQAEVTAAVAAELPPPIETVELPPLPAQEVDPAVAADVEELPAAQEPEPGVVSAVVGEGDEVPAEPVEPAPTPGASPSSSAAGEPAQRAGTKAAGTKAAGTKAAGTKVTTDAAGEAADAGEGEEESPVIVGPVWDASGAPVAAEVQVEVLDDKGLADAAGRGVAAQSGVRVISAGGARFVQVAMDVSEFADGWGGNYLSRLRFADVEKCPPAAVSPAEAAAVADCTATPVEGSLDVQALRLSAVVDTVTGEVSSPLPDGGAPAPVAPLAPAGTAGSGTGQAAGAGSSLTNVFRVFGTALPMASEDAPAAGAAEDSGDTVSGSALQAASVGSIATLAVAAAPTSSGGSYTATPLGVSGSWSVGLNAGSFGWSWPIPETPSVGGSGPGLSLAYNSQAVDGRTSAENGQVSQVGQGWDLTNSFVERRLKPCKDEADASAKGMSNWGDLCAGPATYVMSLNGQVDDLIQVGSTDEFRLRSDPGWRIMREFGSSSNGDNQGEKWMVRTPDGTQYYFGLGVTSWSTSTATNSVWTVPVFGDDTGEPCNTTTLALSYCSRAWRWNLDRVLDAAGNMRSYTYTKEMNRYARNGVGARSDDYVRGGFLAEVLYGARLDGLPTSSLDLNSQKRCTDGAQSTSSTACPAMTEANKAQYPDVPVDLICTATCTADQASPTFFSGFRTSVIFSKRRPTGTGTTWNVADKVELLHTFPDPDGTGAETPELWLSKIRRTPMGADDATAVSPTDVVFGSELLQNRLSPGTGEVALQKYRVDQVTNELGGQVSVQYGHASSRACTAVPSDPARNGNECFRRWFTPESGAAKFGWFHKYVVKRTIVSDPGTRAYPGAGLTRPTSEAQVTDYDYPTLAAWHFDDDPLTKVAEQSWSQWRGYGKVRQFNKAVASGVVQSTNRTFLEYTYFRGMYGDHITNTESRTDTVDTIELSTDLNDVQQLAGRLAEKRWINVDDSTKTQRREYYQYWTHKSVDVPDAVHTGGSGDSTFWVTRDAFMVRQEQTRVREYRAGGTDVRNSATVTRFAVTADLPRAITTGLPIEVEDQGVQGVTDDAEHCTRTDYRRHSQVFLVVPRTVKVFKGLDCATTELTRTHYFYDGEPTSNMTLEEDAKLIRGQLTRTDAYASIGTGATVVSTQNTYDDYGRVLTAVDGRGYTTNTTYSPLEGAPTLVTVATPEPVTGAAKLETRTAYETERGLPIRTWAPNDGRTDLTYDPMGRLKTVVAPAQQGTTKITAAFDYFIRTDQPSSVKTTALVNDTDTESSWALIDGLGRPVQTQVVGPAATADAKQVLATNTRYDDQGRVRGVSAPLRINLTDSEPYGAWLATDFGAYPNDSRTSYDDVGRVIESSVWSNQSGAGDTTKQWATTTSYGENYSTTTPPSGGRVTNWTDTDGRITTVHEKAADGTTTYASTALQYTALGHLKRVTSPQGKISTYTYDMLGRRTASTDPDAGASSSTYDDNGNVVTTTDATGAKVTTVYDRINRPLRRHTGDPGATGTNLAVFTYDTATKGAGLLASSTSYAAPGTAPAYVQAPTEYDSSGRPLGTTWTVPAGTGVPSALTYTESYAYDAAGHVKTVTLPAAGGLPAETVTAAWNNRGRPANLSTSVGGNLVVSTGYDALDRLTGRAYGAATGWDREYAYDWADRLRQVVTTNAAGSVRQSDDYTYTRERLTGVRDNQAGQSTCYAFDNVRRLERAWTTDAACTAAANPNHAFSPAGAPAMDLQWTFDTDNTITGIQDRVATATTTLAAPTSTGQPAHAAGTITTAGSTSAAVPNGTTTNTYNANGYLTGRSGLGGTDTLTWNENKQLKRSVDAGVTTDFVYGPDSARWIRKTPTETTLTIGSTEVVYPSGGGTATGRRYYTLGGVRVAVRTSTSGGSSSFTWMAADPQASTDITMAPGDTTLTRTRYTPYGDVRTTPGPFGTGLPATDKGWLGKTYDQTTGLNHLAARYHDPDHGQFTAPDPLYAPLNPRSINPYTYAHGNPIALSDPTGLEPRPWHNPNYDKVSQEDKDKYVIGYGGYEETRRQRQQRRNPRPEAPYVGRAMNSSNNDSVDPEDVGARGIQPGQTHFVAPNQSARYNLTPSQAAHGALPLLGFTPLVGEPFDIADGFLYAAEGDWGNAVLSWSGAVTGLGTISGVKRLHNLGESLAKACSFTGDTTVLMADGTKKRIDDVQVGDKVMASDPETGEQAPRTVTQVFVHLDDVRDLLVEGEVIATTEDHPFWSATTNRFKRADELSSGEGLLTSLGTMVRVQGLDALGKRRTLTYNLSVDGIHTYHVGVRAVLVHNSCSPSQIPHGPAPEDAATVLRRVDAKGAPLPGYKGGKAFANDGGPGAQRLPDGVTYREWDLSPNVQGVPRDARRLVTGSDGSAYYTTDHYHTFTMIRSGQ